MRALSVKNIEVPEEVVEKMKVIVSIKLHREVKEKELGTFIANLLQEWAYNMDSLIKET